jgi:hypothetical protein
VIRGRLDGMKRTLAGIVATAALAAPLAAGEPASSPVGAKAALERLKALAGEWRGSVESPDGPATSVRYEVTSGGSVVMETQFPGTDHEMRSLYHLDGEELVLTHYCAMGNQPRMRLARSASTLDELVFEFDGGTNLDPARDVHVHSGRVRFEGDGRLRSEWTVFQGERQVGANTFFLTRKAD